jgi:hypothetical protein
VGNRARGGGQESGLRGDTLAVRLNGEARRIVGSVGGLAGNLDGVVGVAFVFRRWDPEECAGVGKVGCNEEYASARG